METIIEESIWCVKKRLPLRKVIFRYDGKTITRNLFILGNSEKRNAKIDVIDLENMKLSIDLAKVNSLSPIEIGDILKERAKDFEPKLIFDNNVSGDLEFFKYPIITRK